MALLPKTVRGPLRAPTAPLPSDHFETEPGADSALAPPLGFDQDASRYLDFMRHRYLNNPRVRQCIIIAALRANREPHREVVTYAGPYAACAKAIIENTARRLREQKGKG